MSIIQKIQRVCPRVGRRKTALEIARAGTQFILRLVAVKANKWANRLEKAPKLCAEDRALLALNALFRNRHQGKPCFVIGNGPSLTTQDLSPLSEELTFVMSGFWKHPLVKQCQPTYYCFADPLFFDGSSPMKAFFNNLLSHIHTTTFFVPLFASNAIKKNYLLPLEQTFFVLFHGNLENGLPVKLDFIKPVPYVQSVSQMAIMAAIYMGCSPIYLLGLDHDWLAHRGQDRHFYEGKTVDGHPKAHGDLDRYSYKLDLVAALKLWNGYEQLRDYAIHCDIQIINATCGGFLDVFPRVSYDNLVFEKGKLG